MVRIRFRPVAENVNQVEFDENNLVLVVDGETYRFPLKIVSSRLAEATDTERRIYQISPSGYGIHWLMLDEDLSIDGLLRLAQKDKVQASDRQ